jgi:hypothetical protein
MKEIFQKWVGPIVGILIGSACIAYGMSSFIPMVNALALLIPILLGAYWFLVQKSDVFNTQSELMIFAENVIEEQELVIREYERIFDSQLVDIPCVCGVNTFQGLISPTLENIVECEKCKNKYRVEVSYSSVLISEPMNLNKTFEQLVVENSEESVN